MSGRRSRSRQSMTATSRISDDQMVELISKLQSLLPAEARPRNQGRVSASKVLQETCKHIRSLHQEVDDLSERLAELLDTIDANSAQAAIIRGLLL